MPSSPGQALIVYGSDGGPTVNLVDAMEAEVSRFVDLVEPDLSLALSLWSLATHVYQQFDAFPYLAVCSPTEECGKSSVFGTLALFAARPAQRLDPTGPSIYRKIEKDKPTLLIDESLDYSNRSNQKLKSIINGGSKKGPGIERYGKEYAVYCPKAFALVGQLPPDLSSRCIDIFMLPGAPERRVPQPGRDSYLNHLAEKCQKWAEKEEGRVQQYNDGIQTDAFDLKSRGGEIWTPLFVVCALAAPHRMAQLQQIVERMLMDRREARARKPDMLLLADIRDILDRIEGPRILSRQIIDELRKLEDWNDMTTKGLSVMLEPYRIYSVRMQGGLHGYMRRSFAVILERYADRLPPRPQRAYTATTSSP